MQLISDMPKLHIDDQLSRLAKYDPVCNTWSINWPIFGHVYDPVSVMLQLCYIRLHLV